MIIKQLSASVNRTKGLVADAIISTETIDRDGEVLISQGMDSTEFDANPVVFYNHDYAQPIGRISELRRGENKIEASIEFAQRPEGYEGSYFPQFVESLVDQGIVKGISVGFVPLEGGVRRASKEDKSKYGESVTNVFSKWKLLEVSVAPLPANQTALVQAVRKGAIDLADVKRWLNYYEEPAEKATITITVPKHGRLSRL